MAITILAICGYCFLRYLGDKQDAEGRARVKRFHEEQERKYGR